jgi:hypothetical protein
MEKKEEWREDTSLSGIMRPPLLLLPVWLVHRLASFTSLTVNRMFIIRLYNQNYGREQD